MNYRIAQPTPLVLRETDEIRRNKTRPERLRESNYTEKYDDRTIFYDAVIRHDQVLLPGPPLLNLEALVSLDTISVDGRRPLRVETSRLERTQITKLTFEEPITSRSELKLDYPGVGPLTTQITPTDTSEFRDAKVLLTMQKDEELIWIRDWASYYATIHECNAVIIFDNNSTKYSNTELLNTIQSVPGVETAVVVNWPFKYGPQGGVWVGTSAAWDSDFCQIGAFQTARYKFLPEARGMINADIDELVVPLTESTVFDELENSTHGVIGYGGHWIENRPINLSPEQLPKHKHFFLTQGRKSPCAMKWSGVPGRWPETAQPTAHYVRNIDYLPSPNFYTAHFRGLNSGWKTQTRLKEVSSSHDLLFDENLADSLRTAHKHHIGLGSVMPENINKTTDMHEYRFQSWLRNQIDDYTSETITWNKKWLWKGSVPVFEASTHAGTVAFDLHIAEQSVDLAVSVRDKSMLPELQIAINTIQTQLDTNKPKHLGFWTSSAQYNNREDNSWNLAATHISAQILIVWEALSSAATQRVTGSGEFVSENLSHQPLRNLRGDQEFNRLADSIRKFAGHTPLLYVPNEGNWGYALIHKGILQFFDYYGINYKVTTRHEVKRLAASMERLGSKIDDLVLVSGGGGSWRNEQSGNFKFVKSVAPAFAKMVVLPHTYETEKIPFNKSDVLYIARDSSISRTAIPESRACHDMAFFLQLPLVLDIPKSKATGVFLRNDPERHPSANSLGAGYDLSSMGNHLSPITPFFQVLAQFSQIVTDRMHVAIASAMLGLEVELYPGNYNKSVAVYSHTIQRFYPNVVLRSWD